MKNLILTIAFLVAATVAFAETQRSAYFNPASEAITLYRESTSGFRYSVRVAVADMSAPQQQTVDDCLDWLQSQLATGETLTQAVFQPYQIPDDPTTVEVDESGLGLRAAVTGRKASGAERTLPLDSKDVPSEVRAGLVGLWTDLAALPTPTPAP